MPNNTFRLPISRYANTRAKELHVLMGDKDMNPLLHMRTDYNRSTGLMETRLCAYANAEGGIWCLSPDYKTSPEYKDEMFLYWGIQNVEMPPEVEILHLNYISPATAKDRSIIEREWEKEFRAAGIINSIRLAHEYVLYVHERVMYILMDR